MRRTAIVLCWLMAACASASDGEVGAGRGGGVALRRGALTYVGNATFCSRPATIDAVAAAAATNEQREIDRERVAEGSARHALLTARMHDRIVAAARKAAQARGCDLVVRDGDIADARGLAIVDLTPAVVAEL